MAILWRGSLNVAYKTGRKFVVAIIGITVVLFGFVLIFTPGPAFVFIPLGLAILGLEFAWARRWLVYLKQRTMAVADQYQRTKKKQTEE
ncbi:MAG: PGPGW domain-containing protein [Gammaproteobacteria bacterium]|nr:PGPGW domain-containing protein [Gammaproteobacteria bacterium]